MIDDIVKLLDAITRLIGVVVWPAFIGLSFELATSTDEALKKIENEHFDVIISDMARPSDSKAGYTLLDKIRTNGNQTPFIVYAAGIRSPEHQA